MQLLRASNSEIAPRHPALLPLLELWQRKCAGRAVPSRADFDWSELRPWFGNLVLVDVIDGGADFRYRLWGSELAAFFGYELTGRTVSEVMPWLGPNLMRQYRRVCSIRAPYSVLVQIPDDAQPVRLDRLNLPLGADGQSVDKVMASLYPAAA